MSTTAHDELSARRDHRPPIWGIAALGAVVVGFLVYGRPHGWWQAAIVVVLLAVAYGVFKWYQGHTVLTLGDDTIGVRSPLGHKEVRGVDIARVRELPNGRSPNHMLVGVDGSKLLVPSSEVRRGHSALFRWLAVYAPEAELDKRSRRTRALLESRGQLAAPTDRQD